MFINKPEGPMSEGIGSLHRRGLARGLKIFLDVLFFLTLFVGILLLISIPISAFTAYDEGWDANFPVAVGEGLLYPTLPVQVHETGWPGMENVRVFGARGELRFLHHSLPTHLAVAGIYILYLGVFLWGVTLLRRILAATAGARPFDPLNVRRLNALGWIIVAAAALTSALEFLASRWVLSRLDVVDPVPLSPSVQIHVGWIICGFTVLILAGIWRTAVHMAEDQALTV
jgi:hypothetical protein